MTRAQIAILGLLLVGCDGVGRALVGTNADGDSNDLACAPVECTDVVLPPVRPVPPSFTDPQLAQCKPSDPGLCDPASEPSPDLAGNEPAPCRRTLSLDDDFDEAALRSLGCSKLKLSRTQAGEGAVRLEGVRWTQVALEIESRDPLRLELAGAQLMQVSLHLRGPVEVRMVERAKVERVSVTGDDSEASFELDGSVADTFRAGEEEREYAGRLLLVRSTVKAAHLRARELHFETVSLVDSTLETQRLDWFDVTARRVQLAVDEAAISASRLHQFDITRCGQLSTYRVLAEQFRVPSCSGDRVRLFESLFTRGSFDGVLAADASEFNQVVFGFREPTVLQLWDASLGNTNFCGGTERVVLAGKVTTVCAICREMDAVNVPIDACTHKNAKLQLLKSCTKLEDAPFCMPTPERMRPPLN